MPLDNTPRSQPTLAQALQCYETARDAYEACFRGVDPFFAPVRCQQSKRALAEARDQLQTCMQGEPHAVLTHQAQAILNTPVQSMGFRIDVRSINPPPVPNDLP